MEFLISGVESFDFCHHSVNRPLYRREVLKRMASVAGYSRNFLSGVEKRILNVPQTQSLIRYLDETSLTVLPNETVRQNSRNIV